MKSFPNIPISPVYLEDLSVTFYSNFYSKKKKVT